MEQVNAIGEACPIPVIKAKKRLAEITEGQLEVLVDNDIAVQNICRLAESEKCGIEIIEDNGIFHIILLKGQVPQSAPDSSAVIASVPSAPILKPISEKTVVILSADTMGSGSDELGRILMKGFIYALTQLDKLPDTVLLYNTGARLAVAGSESLQDLIALERAGTTVKTCGTCLNYFEVADQLGVGEVTNMYSIVEEMREAGRILRP